MQPVLHALHSFAVTPLCPALTVAPMLQIEVSLSSYLERVAERVSWPRDGARDAAITAEAQLEEFKAVLTKIDTFGIQGAESVDEAQVRVASNLHKVWRHARHAPPCSDSFTGEPPPAGA